MMSMPVPPMDEGVDAGECKKLAILGLPWETSEDKLREYFSQFGPVESAEVMKDRYTGKSRGFGFVSFVDAASAIKALHMEHSIDGRRCEAKIALPKGDPMPPRTTRIFVARIHPSVTEVQFRSYFEAFGKLQDAYMPKDHAKQGYRGIGFVTYASPDSVEKIMASKHWLNGHEIAIDRATPKEEPANLKQMFQRLPLTGPTSRRSFDNGANIIGPGLINVGPGMGPHGAYDNSYQLRALSEDREINGGAVSSHQGRLDPVMEMSPTSGGYGVDSSGQQQLGRNNLGLNLGLGLQAPGQSSAAAAAAAATNVALQSLAKSQQEQQQQQAHAQAMAQSLAQLPMGQHQAGMGLQTFSNDISASLLSNALSKVSLGRMSNGSPGPEVNVAMQQLMAAAAAQQSGRRSLDAATAHLKRLERLENPAIVNARAGPRIFIGKLTKETSEADVKDYFSKFGYVMDVYLPKSKDNKLEHRGFGFVTFETEAAIQRVVQHGTHRLKGSTIAIDLAMPKIEEDGLLEGSLEGQGFSAMQLGLMSQRL